jgi:8-oxo-dGTP pyrophosphatase MutT (NUDIX family)
MAGVESRGSAVPVTLALLRSGERVLLLRYPATKDRFPGQWSLPGGHVEPAEDVRAAARREVIEEARLDPGLLRLRAIIHESGLLGAAHLLFLFDAEVEPARVFRGARAGPAGELRWFTRDEIPWPDVVADLRETLPRLLESDALLFGVQEFDGSDGPLRFEIS